MFDIILLLHVVFAVVLIALILLQQGKGADMGAAFGSGSANTFFGSQGPASFLMKLTASLMALFFVTSLILGHLSSSHAQSGLEGLPQTVQSQSSTQPVSKQSVVKEHAETVSHPQKAKA